MDTLNFDTSWIKFLGRLSNLEFSTQGNLDKMLSDYDSKIKEWNKNPQFKELYPAVLEKVKKTIEPY